MVMRLGMASLAMLLAGTTVAAHATPMACRQRLLPPAREATGPRAITARDIIELRDFGRIDSVAAGMAPFAISPDGRYAAIALRRGDVDANSYCFGIAVVELDRANGITLVDAGGEFIPSVNDIRGVPAIPNGLPLTPTPLWSRDGKSIVYLRRDRGITQVWRATLDGEPARPLTNLQTDALSLEWSDDRRRLLVATRASLHAAGATIEQEGLRGYHFDARFWTLFEAKPRPRLPLPEQISELDPDAGTLRALTSDEATRLRSAPELQRPAGAIQFARSPTGNRAWTAPEEPGQIFSPAKLHIEAGGKELLCPPEICARRIAGIWWDKDDELLILRGGGPDDTGLLRLYRWKVGEDHPRLVISTAATLMSCTPWRDALLCARETSSGPRTLVRLDTRTGDTHILFDPNPEFRTLRLGTVERLSFKNARGMQTFGDLVLPPTHRPGQRHPLVVTQYHSTGFLRGGTGDDYPIFLLAQHGFAVLSFQKPTNLPNVERARDINELQRLKVENWAERRAILSTLEAGIDAAIAGGAIDPDRIGLTGMSDGASTTQFALLNSNRFRAAAISSCCDEPSVLFTVGPAYRDAALAWGYPKQGDDGRAFWKPVSLAQNAARLRVPLLIQVPEAEYRLSLETVSALEQHGAPVDMYVFPGEYHVKVQPAHRLAVHERAVGWFEFWLRGTVSNRVSLAQEVARWEALRNAIEYPARPPATTPRP